VSWKRALSGRPECSISAERLLKAQSENIEPRSARKAAASRRLSPRERRPVVYKTLTRAKTLLDDIPAAAMR
jgi:hypothetical protein